MRGATRPVLIVLLALAGGCKPAATEPVPRSPHAPPLMDCEAATEPLDLSTLVDRPECKRSEDPVAIEASAVEVFLSPAPLDLAAGERGMVQVYIVNASDRPVDIDLELSCDPWRGFTLTAIDSADEDFSFAQGVPGDDGRWKVFTVEDAACARYPVRVTLPVSGKAFMPVAFDPSMEWENRNLKLVAEAPFAPGQYTLKSEIPLASSEPLVAKGVLRVK